MIWVEEAELQRLLFFLPPNGKLLLGKALWIGLGKFFLDVFGVVWAWKEPCSPQCWVVPALDVELWLFLVTARDLGIIPGI